jgi:hypothetical protein
MMKKMLINVLILLALLAVTVAVSAAPPEARNFVAPLSGSQEVPVRETNARGNTIFHLNTGETELSYKLIVANIENVFAAHIHCAPAGVNGPVGVTLYVNPAGIGGGRIDGVIAEGVRTAPDAGNGCGWASIADVAAAMRSGNTYVNVHTNDGIDPPNTGPGDFPGGEIRGQIQ